MQQWTAPQSVVFLATGIDPEPFVPADLDLKAHTCAQLARARTPKGMTDRGIKNIQERDLQELTINAIANALAGLKCGPFDFPINPPDGHTFVLGWTMRYQAASNRWSPDSRKAANPCVQAYHKACRDLEVALHGNRLPSAVGTPFGTLDDPVKLLPRPLLWFCAKHVFGQDVREVDFFPTLIRQTGENVGLRYEDCLFAVSEVRSLKMSGVSAVDAPLLDEMHQMMTASPPRASGISAAARQVAIRASGNATLETKIERLRKGYTRRYGRTAKPSKRAR